MPEENALWVVGADPNRLIVTEDARSRAACVSPGPVAGSLGSSTPSPASWTTCGTCLWGSR